MTFSFRPLNTRPATGAARGEKPSGKQWLRAVEALLTAAERAWLKRSMAKMTREQLARVMALDPETAATELRFERSGPMGMKTR
jgi:hypothetical protein